MDVQKISSTPLEKIALSCSGGGYRAASFHLGSMSYLNRLKFIEKPLLENVKFLSTVSGGTITGIVYALMKNDGKDFDEIYHFLLKNLKELDLIKTGISQLNPDAQWDNNIKTKNLINAFAEQYDKSFTSGRRMEEFFTLNSHLENVVFNSTEFSNAINFRFKNPDNGTSGNFAIRITKDQLKEIKLSDVMASSSCFPGGFEPMLWPNDYVHSNSPGLSSLCQKNLENGKKPVGIMDGGIYDNQGIQSILNYKKKEDEPYFDLVIISDVASPYFTGYKPFESESDSGFRKWTVKDVIAKINKVGKTVHYSLIFSVAFFLVLPVFWKYSNTIATGFSLTLAAVLSGVLVARSIVIGKATLLWEKIKKGVSKLIPDFYFQKLKSLNLQELSIDRVEPLVVNRLNSLLTLLLDVFLKVVRRLGYEKLYEDERYEYRKISNLIKELSRMGYRLKSPQTSGEASSEAISKAYFFKGNYDEDIGSDIEKIVTDASSFGTTLWFTEDQVLENMLQNLIVTGQITMCYNFIIYLEEIVFTKDNGFDELPQSVKNDISKTLEDCKKDWKLFKESPDFLFAELDMSRMVPTTQLNPIL